MKYTVLSSLALTAALGVAAGPTTALRITTVGSEALSVLITGALFLLLAAAAKRIPVARNQG